MLATTFTLGLSKMDQVTYTSIFENDNGLFAFDVEYPDYVACFVKDPNLSDGLRHEGRATKRKVEDADLFRFEFGGFLFKTSPVAYDVDAMEQARQIVLTQINAN